MAGDAASRRPQIPNSLPANAQSSSVDSEAAKEVLALDDEIEALLRSNSPERTALWAGDLVYITNHGAVLDKASVAKQVLTDQVHVESLEFAETRVRVYGDLAVVTALERMRASFHGKDARDLVQRYTRIWLRRGGKWQIVFFQATGVTDMAPPTAGFETCSSEPPTAGPAPAPGSTEEMILRLEDQHAEANTPRFKGDEATRAALGFGMLGEDYLAINSRGALGDKAFAMRLYGSEGINRLAEQNSNR